MKKPMKVLIGYDGSSYADAALDDLLLAGLPSNVEALVISVGEGLVNPSELISEVVETSLTLPRVELGIALAREPPSRLLEEAWRFAAQACSRVQSHFPNWNVHAQAFSVEPATQLIQMAELWKADLIVVGSRGLSALGRLFLGSVSKTVASEVRCSVRIVRRSTGKTRVAVGPRIIIGVDGSPGAARAVRVVGMRSWPKGTEVRLIAVGDGSSPTGIKDVTLSLEQLVTAFSEDPPVDSRVMAEGAQIVLQAEGLSASVEIMEGNPWRVLIEEARNWKADCLFVGARGMENMTEESGLGSVATKLVTGAHCSVELVR
jgi:nucleotide-binding universal stress UspA family protein